MEYNTDREKLHLPEYGRNLQNMIEKIATIENREERTRLTKDIVNIVSQMSTEDRDGNFWHRLWDQVYIMSNFSLDVDAPYPAPSQAEVSSKPRRIPYNTNNIRYRHYGNLIYFLIKKAAEMEESPEKNNIISLIASQMKKLYLIWNRDTVDDDLIFKNLEELSGGSIKVDPNLRLASTATILYQEKNRTLKSSSEPQKKTKNKSKNKSKTNKK